jgi:internalin A
MLMFADISPLSTLTSLTCLDLARCMVADISPLSTLTSLTSLDLSRCSMILDYSPLIHMTALVKLGVRETENVASLDELRAQRPDLRDLEVQKAQLKALEIFEYILMVNIVVALKER